MNEPKAKCVLALGIFLLLILTGVVSASNEDDETEVEQITKFIKKKRINAAYLMFGASALRLSSLNSYLETSKLPKANDQFFTYGVGGHVVNNKLVLGLEFVHSITRYNRGKTGFNIYSRFRYSVLNFGYLLKSDKGLMCYPYLGFGVGGLMLTVQENNIDEFGDITGIQKGSTSKKICLLSSIGFGLDYFHKYNKKKKGHGNFVLGVRAGYIISPKQSHWRINKIKVTDGPDSGINGPYIRLTVGIGGWIEKIIQKVF